MSKLGFSSLNVSMRKALTVILGATILALVIVAILAAPVEATTCTSWAWSGTCCDTWYPGEQDFNARLCSECNNNGCYYWYEYNCQDMSLCGPD